MPELPPNSRPLYRILTEKSRLGFGKYADLTIKDILILQPMYVAWLYYCNPQISLKQELKDALLITDDIKKPGKDEDLYAEWKKKWSSQFTDEQKQRGCMKRAAIRRKKSKIAVVNARRAENLSKRTLQAINHGHIPNIP